MTLTLLFVLPLYNHILYRQHPVCCTIIFIQRKEENWLSNAFFFFFFFLSEAEWVTHLMVISKNSWLKKIWWNTPVTHWTSYSMWLMPQVLHNFLHNPISCREFLWESIVPHSRRIYLWMSQLQNCNTEIQILEACVHWASMGKLNLGVCWMRFLYRLIHLTRVLLASVWPDL